jgi:hypothetical protein
MISRLAPAGNHEATGNSNFQSQASEREGGQPKGLLDEFRPLAARRAAQLKGMWGEFVRKSTKIGRLQRENGQRVTDITVSAMGLWRSRVLCSQVTISGARGSTTLGDRMLVRSSEENGGIIAALDCEPNTPGTASPFRDESRSIINSSFHHFIMVSFGSR